LFGQETLFLPRIYQLSEPPNSKAALLIERLPKGYLKENYAGGPRVREAESLGFNSRKKSSIWSQPPVDTARNKKMMKIGNASVIWSKP
jgi:hypothetical protein